MRREKRIRTNERRGREMGEEECPIGVDGREPKRKGGLQGVKRGKCGKEDVKAEEREKKTKQGKKERKRDDMNEQQERGKRKSGEEDIQWRQFTR